MAWGGPKEQEAECANGNPNAKDWHDEVHKLVEKTMEDYWDDGCSTPAAAVPHTNTVTAGDDVFPNENTLQSDYDRLRRELIQQIVRVGTLVIGLLMCRGTRISLNGGR